MSLKCMKTWLTTWALILMLGAPAFGQGLADMQFFAPPANDGFGGGRHQREGFFFSAEWLRMSISNPEDTPIGFESDSPGDVYTSIAARETPTNAFNTGFLGSKFVSGMRYEFGDIQGHHGWFFSGYLMHEQGQSFSPTGGGQLIIDDPANFSTANDIGIAPDNILAGTYYGRTWGVFGREEGGTTVELELLPMPVYFGELTMEQEVQHWSVEVNYLYRAHPTHRGGMFEFFGGMRYLEFNDRFGITGRGSPFVGVTTTYPGDDDGDDDTDDDVIEYEGTPAGPGSIFHDSHWITSSDNHIIAPQLGVRWSRSRGRWSIISEARFFAGFNRQNLHQFGVLGSEVGSENYRTLLEDTAVDDMHSTALDPLNPINQWVPLGMNAPISFNHTRHANEWTPGIEFRLSANWQLTDVISLQAGYNLIWMDGIARSANMTNYSFDGDIFGINLDHNRQDVFMNAFSLGCTFNR